MPRSRASSEAVEVPPALMVMPKSDSAAAVATDLSTNTLLDAEEAAKKSGQNATSAQPSQPEEPASSVTSKPTKYQEMPTLPTFQFGDDDIYHKGLLARLGPLTRSVRQEFADNEDGTWTGALQYVVDKPAQELYPSTKGYAPKDKPELVPSFTRDKGRTGWTLAAFHEQQPAVQRSLEQSKVLSLAEIAILRVYTGPWFKAVNFYLRYGPTTVFTCDAQPYFKHHDASKCYLAKTAASVCLLCGKPKAEHHEQELHSWATSCALLTNAINKLSNAQPKRHERQQTVGSGLGADDSTRDREASVGPGAGLREGSVGSAVRSSLEGGGKAASGKPGKEAAPKQVVVYRGVREDKVRLPSSFTGDRATRPEEDSEEEEEEEEEAGGVELAPMSTTFDLEVACAYAATPGSVMLLELDKFTRGAELGFLSQYAHEKEMLFPPGTALACKRVEERGAASDRSSGGFGRQRFLYITPRVNPDTKLVDEVRRLTTVDDAPRAAPQWRSWVLSKAPREGKVATGHWHRRIFTLCKKDAKSSTWKLIYRNPHGTEADDPRGTILLEDVEQVRAVLARERRDLPGLKTAVEPLVEIKMKPLERIKRNLPGAAFNKELLEQNAERKRQADRVFKLKAAAERAHQEQPEPLKQLEILQSLLEELEGVLEDQNDLDREKTTARVQSDFKPLLELVAERDGERSFTGVDCEGALLKQRDVSTFSFSGVHLGNITSSRRYFVLSLPRDRFPLLRYHSGAKGGADSTYHGTAGGGASYLLSAESVEDFRQLRLRNVLPCEWISEVALRGDEVRASGSKQSSHRYLKLTLREFEGVGATFVLRQEPSSAGGSIDLQEWRERLGKHKAHTAHRPIFGVMRLTAVGGFPMHILRLAYEQLELFTAGRLELRIRLSDLASIGFDERHVDGRDRGLSFRIRFRYESAWRPLARRASFSAISGRGELSLLMQSTRDVALVNAWVPATIHREHHEALEEEAAAINEKLSQETQPVHTGKLRIRHRLFWRSHHVALYWTGQLVISDRTGTRPLQVVNLLNVPVLRTHADKQLTIRSVVGAIHLRSGDDDAKEQLDVWTAKIQVATRRAPTAHGIGGAILPALQAAGGGGDEGEQADPEEVNADLEDGVTSVAFADAIRQTFSQEAWEPP